jgi:glyoxylase-like metal-dependent hydrolase (beta-lactamase superfamily II)
MTLSRRTVLATGAAAAAAGALPIVGTPARAAAPKSGKAAPAFYRFKLGDYEVTAIHDGIVQQPAFPDNFVRNAPKEEVQKAYAAVGFPTDRLTISFTTLVVNTGSKLVVLDTGFADNGAPSVGAMGATLAAAGIDPKAVDTVLISHFHGDHISGIRSKGGDTVFSNAEHMVSEVEWKH